MHLFKPLVAPSISFPSVYNICFCFYIPYSSASIPLRSFFKKQTNNKKWKHWLLEGSSKYIRKDPTKVYYLNVKKNLNCSYLIFQGLKQTQILEVVCHPTLASFCIKGNINTHCHISPRCCSVLTVPAFDIILPTHNHSLKNWAVVASISLFNVPFQCICIVTTLELSLTLKHRWHSSSNSTKMGKVLFLSHHAKYWSYY